MTIRNSGDPAIADILKSAQDGARTITHNPDIIDESAAEIILRYKERTLSGRPPENPTHWAFICGQNEARAILSRGSKYKELTASILDRIIDPSPTEETALIDAIDSAPIKTLDADQAIAGISELLQITTTLIERHGNETDRLILKLHYEQHFSFSRISNELGITEDCARQRWYRLITSITAEIMRIVRDHKILAKVFAAIIEDEHDFRCSILGLLSIIASKGFSAIEGAIHSVFGI